jgi:isoleucyl-tRNA synthetase
MDDNNLDLNLPRTPFLMEAQLIERVQPQILQRWRATDIYRAILEERRDREPFILHDGPPYASGQIHIGIGMNKIIKDMIAKFYSMNDRRVPFVPGWDCHGLPIEIAALKELGTRDEPLSPAEIREHCARFALRYVKEQKEQFQLLGIFADWDRPYLTMNASYEAGVLTVLNDMVDKGYVYHDLLPVPWCTHCQTSLAEAEIQYKRTPEHSLWIHFEGGPELARRFGASEDYLCSLLIWTTSLWSLPGAVAIAARPDLVYAAYEYDDHLGRRTTVVLEQLAARVFAELGVNKYVKVGSLAGQQLEPAISQHPLSQARLPVVFGDFVRADSGTGLVQIVPTHGTDDAKVARESGLQGITVVDTEGKFTSRSGNLAGLGVTEGERAISKQLAKTKALAAVHEYDYPHCWRCDTPLISQATPQWFVRMDHQEQSAKMSLRQRALLEVQVVNWIPRGSGRRLAEGIEQRPDWCISRQRTWGVPIPAFTCLKCHESILVPEGIRHVRDLVGTHGSAVWFQRSAADLLPDNFACPHCGCSEFEKQHHILDIWFESGTSWQSMLIADHRLNFPADLYVEGNDQHRGWFQLSLLPALVNRGRAPYNSVLTHGFVLNERRDVMSRAHGDFVTLKETLEHVPADLIRLYFASVDITTDIPLSLEKFELAIPQYRKFRDTFRFLLGNLFDFSFHEDFVHLDDLHPLDLWALNHLHEVISKVSVSYRAYEFQAVVRQIHEFCNNFLSRIYFDVLKDRLKYESPKSLRRRSAQTVLHSTLTALVKLLAPILPYTCDEVWALTPGQADCPSVHLSRWPKTDEQMLGRKRSHEASDTYQRFSSLRDEVNNALEKLRMARAIGGNAEAVVRLHVSEGIEQFLGLAEIADLRDFLLVSQVVVETHQQGFTPVPALPGTFIAVAPSTHLECRRCRRRDVTCNSNEGHNRFCARCAGVKLQLGQVSFSDPASNLVVSPEMRPAHLADFLAARDIRKLAILKEDTGCRAYALHSPSQEVLPLPELQPLADYVSASLDLRDHTAVLLGLGEHTDVLFGIGIHHLKFGTPLGGTREFAYPRVRDMLDNLLRLSWGMSVKNAVAELPHGGGKSIIDTCGRDLKVLRELRREIYRDFGQFTATLFGRYICAEDVGNNTADTREMLYACRHVMCLSQGVGGSGNPSRFTALAAWAAAKAGWKFLTGGSSFSGLTIALQGSGNVARNLVPILIEADPEIARILVADRDSEQIQIIRNLLLKSGSETLLEILSSKDPDDKDPATVSYVERDDEAGRDYILHAPCDILIPVAVGNVINPQKVPRLNCRLILPIANNVYSDNDTIAAAMFARGIVDVVENNVNWGGALAAASELYGYDEDNVTLACIDAYHKTLALLEQSREQNRPPWSIVKERASKRIFEESHPVVSEARSYKFIGDINSNFATWIKERWLRNVVDVDPDKFASYAVGKAFQIGGHAE